MAADFHIGGPSSPLAHNLQVTGYSLPNPGRKCVYVEVLDRILLILEC